MSNPLYSPVQFPGATISSGIGPRVSPGGIGSTNHAGIDIAAPRGTPVYAPTDLTISRAEYSPSYGNVIYGEDSRGYQYRFAHLDQYGVVKGQTVPAGVQIGQIGSTGKSTGNHLHFEVRDAAGNVVKDYANSIVKGGLSLGKEALEKAAKDVANVALNLIPGGNLISAGLDIAGINPFGDGCGIICQIKKWFNETQFFQRAGLMVLGFIFIIGAIVFFARGEASKVISEVAK